MNVKSFEKFIKIFIIFAYTFFILLDYSCTGGGNFKFSESYNSPNCILENKKISVYPENINVPYLRLFIKGTRGIFVNYHVYYKNDLGEKNDILTYRFPFTYGLDVIMENTLIMVKETSDAIIIYYDKEPINGFVIKNNPFSKKVLLKYKSDLDELRKNGETCFL